MLYLTHYLEKKKLFVHSLISQVIVIVYFGVDVAASKKSRRNTVAQHQPVRVPADLAQLPNGAGGRGHTGGGRQVCGGHGANHAVPPVRQPSAQHTVPGVRGRAAAHGRLLGVHDPPLHRDHLPPGGHGQDGPAVGQDGRGGPAAQGVRHQGPAGGRRVHHAHVGQCQHQRAGYHDRREGRRHGQGKMAQDQMTATTATTATVANI